MTVAKLLGHLGSSIQLACRDKAYRVTNSSREKFRRMAFREFLKVRIVLRVNFADDRMSLIGSKGYSL